ncbi:hypothetical protein AAFF_G00053710 [Aldrovandia affinis]|uniref:Uncharacterized protein n=1 Tax=Aldrovandia affinis TaxID=143900 RepID=A0AAD7S1F7_9TELE|nr:hypothetical protein AAFF_G00053710 [Aldrovandia affinis]
MCAHLWGLHHGLKMGVILLRTPSSRYLLSFGVRAGEWMWVSLPSQVKDRDRKPSQNTVRMNGEGSGGL